MQYQAMGDDVQANWLYTVTLQQMWQQWQEGTGASFTFFEQTEML